MLTGEQTSTQHRVNASPFVLVYPRVLSLSFAFSINRVIFLLQVRVSTVIPIFSYCYMGTVTKYKSAASYSVFLKADAFLCAVNGAFLSLRKNQWLGQ